MTNNSTGNLNGELNIVHSHFQNTAGTAAQVENYEASMTNFGTIGVHDAFLSVMINKSTGTVTNAIIGTNYELENDNTTPGSIALYAAIQMSAMAGGGSLPTTYEFLQNTDANASSVSLGTFTLGSLTPQTSNLLRITGPDSSSGTIPFIVAGPVGNILYADDAGAVHMNSVLSVGINNNWGKLLFGNTTSGAIQHSAPSSGALSGTVTLPNATTTLAGLAVAETFTAAQTFSASGGIVVGASGPTISSGAGAPSATQPVGSLYLNTSGSSGSRLYVSAGGGSWNAVSGV